ncbi:MAG: ATP-binding protein [Reinekea sp.]
MTEKLDNEGISRRKRKAALGFQNLGWVLSIIILASITIPAVLVGAIEITTRYNTEVVVNAEAEAHALMEVLKEGMNPTLWSFIPENAQPLIEGAGLNEAVMQVTVFDAMNEVFVEYQRDSYQLQDDAIKLTDKVMHYDEVIGTIELEYGIAPARERVLQDAYRIMFITLAQVLISITVILLLIKRRVTSPLMQIKIFAHEIANRHFDSTVDVAYNDEFKGLKDELIAMKSALKESFESLEERVNQRTRDITRVNKELTETVQRLEEAKDSLVQTEKLAALGSLVAGVSHELNTPIGNGRVMSTSLHETARKLKNDFENGTMTRSQFEDALDEMLQGSHLIERNLLKAVNLVQSFKKIAVDRTSDNRRVFKLNEFLGEIQSTLHHMFKKNIFELKLELGTDVELNSYPGVLSQVISNLINNALMHGLEGKQTGRIEVITVSSTDDVKITVRDNGTGMTEDIKKRIFEPFFTTKMGKGGSGLGMHIVHNLTTGTLGGQLMVNSEPGKGTEVSLIIPLYAPEDREQNQSSHK